MLSYSTSPSPPVSQEESKTPQHRSLKKEEITSKGNHKDRDTTTITATDMKQFAQSLRTHLPPLAHPHRPQPQPQLQPQPQPQSHPQPQPQPPNTQPSRPSSALGGGRRWMATKEPTKIGASGMVEKPTEPTALVTPDDSLTSEPNRAVPLGDTAATTPAMVPIYRPPSIEKDFLFPAEPKKDPAMMDFAFLGEEDARSNKSNNHPLPPRTSWNRVLRLQHWIQNSKSQDEVESLDGLLFICGVDGDYNVNSYKMLRHLLDYDSSLIQRTVKNELDAMALEENMEDMTVLITKDSVRVLTNNIALERYAKYIQRWHNVILYCQKPEEAEDRDESEMYKIRSFTKVMEGVHRVGIPSIASETVESWPLIQAYAFEGVGKGVFFSVHHPVVNVERRFKGALHAMDQQTLRDVLTHSAVSLENHFRSVLDLMDSGVWEADRLKLPLLLLWQHANDTQHPEWAPSVRITNLSDENRLIQVEALDSTLKCRAARTYFRMGDGSSQAKDVDTLTRLYDTLCHETAPLIRIACQASSTTPNSSATTSITTEQCLEHLKHCLREEGFPLDSYDITVTIQQLNETLDGWVSAKTGSPRLKYFHWKITLRSNAKETFLENISGTLLEPELLVLTEDIPERRLWQKLEASTPLKEYEHEESNVMTFPTSRAPMYATLALSEDQLALKHVRFGVILLSVGAKIMRFAVDFGKDLGSQAILRLSIARCPLLGSDMSIVLPAKSHLRRHFFNNVLPMWKQKIPFEEHPSPIRSYLERDLLKRCAHFLKQRAFFDFADMLPKERVQALLKQENYAPRLGQDRLPIAIIGGVPGSGRHSIWSSIKAFTGEETSWKLLEHKMDVEDELDTNYFQQQLQNLVFGGASTSALLGGGRRTASVSAANKKSRILILCPGYCSLSKMVHCIQNHPNVLVQNAFEVVSVSVALDLRNLHSNHWEYLPNLKDALSWGWVQNLVVFGSKSSANKATEQQQQQQQVSSLLSLLLGANPDVNLIRASSTGKIYDTEHLNALLNQSWFQQPQNQVKRALSIPADRQELSQASLLGFSTMVLKVQIPLDRQLFHKEIVQAEVHRMKGKVRFSEAPGSLWECNMLRGSLMVNNTPVPQPPEDPSNPAIASTTTAATPISTLVFYGQDLNRDKLKQVVRQCAKKQVSPLIHAQNVRELTVKESQEILRYHEQDALPENWFFNGRCYINLDGSTSEERPDKQEILEAHLKERHEQLSEEFLS